jgi:hypothetical protein
LVGDGPTGWEAIEYDELSDEDRVRFDQVAGEYRRLLTRVLREWDRHGHRQALVAADYAGMSGGTPIWSTIRDQSRRGAPRKRTEERVDVQRYEQFCAITARLSAGYDLKRKRQKGGRYESDLAEIKKALQRLEPAPTAEEVDAILDASSLRQASLHVLQAAQPSRVSLRSLSSSVHRGKALVAKSRVDRDDQ